MISALPSDFYGDNFKNRYKQALLSEMLPTGSAKIITHDLLFQESFLPIAEVIHEIGDMEAFEWFHLIHSGLPKSRPLDQIARCTVPEGHNVIVLNNNDVGMAAAYYQTKNIYVWGNQVSFTDVYPFSEKGLKFAKRIPTDVDVMSVMAADANRLPDKGLEIIIEIHNALQKRGLKTCLAVVDSYNIGTENYIERRKVWEDAYNTENGSLLFMSVEVHTNQLMRGDVFGLLSMADVFILPSISESSSLLLQEAALAKNLLVLNSSVPQLAEQIPHELAMYYPFGGVRYAQRTIDYEKIAQDIHHKLSDSDILKAKQKIMKQNTVIPV